MPPTDLPAPPDPGPAIIQIEGKEDWTHTAPRPPLRLPRAPRQLFDLLAQLDAGEPLSALLARLDCTGLTPGDVQRTAYGTVPAPEQLPIAGPDFDPRAYLEQTLLSDPFRARLLGAFLGAYPEKRRDVFVHLPKTAGTDLTLNLWPRRVSFPTDIGRFGSNLQALEYCARVARLMPTTEDIFVHGHLELGVYVDAAGARPGDRFFTTVREPVDLLISQVSDLLGQMLRDPEARLPQTREWLALMRLPRVPAGLSPAEQRELWITALLNPYIAQPNNMCRHLSRLDGAGTYEAAMANLVAFDVEVTTTSRYTRWLADRWGIRSDTRHNASRRMLDAREVSHRFGSAIQRQMEEDEKLHAVVEWALVMKGASSVRGSEIAEWAGPDLLRGFADELLAEHARPRRATVQAAVPPPPAGALAMVFGQGGNGAEALGRGWSPPEDGYAWTDGTRAALRLPRPASPGDYTLRLRLRPFVVPGRLTRQRLSVRANGTLLGVFALEGAATLDCHLSSDLLAARDRLEIGFALPDAARPEAVVGHSADQRLLGVALERLWLIGPLPQAQSGTSSTMPS